MSKLYTEEQVRIMLSKARIHNQDDTEMFTDDYLIEQQTPIQLPSDEEVYQEAKSKGSLFVRWDMYETSAFVMGAQWMRDKIKGGQDE